MAKSGKAPDVVKNPPDPEHDLFYRSQVFAPDAKEPIEVEMTPMAHCEVTAVDEGVHLWRESKLVRVRTWNGGTLVRKSIAGRLSAAKIVARAGLWEFHRQSLYAAVRRRDGRKREGND